MTSPTLPMLSFLPVILYRSPALSSPDLPSPHLYLLYLGTIEDSSQLNFIYRGFVRLLNNVHLSESSYLPFSVTRMSIEQVTLLQYTLLPSSFSLLFASPS
jgi:hypothetical protein